MKILKCDNIILYSLNGIEPLFLICPINILTELNYIPLIKGSKFFYQS